MKDQLNGDFLAFIELLEAKNVEDLIVGGYAVGLHGFPRYTGDIGLIVEDFLEPDFVIEIGREPRKIQVLTGIDGVEFSECQADRIEIDYGGRTMKFIGLPQLLKNKRASGRRKDLIDLDELSGDQA